MKTLVRLIFSAFLLLGISPLALFAHEPKPVEWSVARSRSDAAVGEEIELVITATIAPHWIVYSSDFKADLGPQPTQFLLADSTAFRPLGAVTSVQPKRKKDPTWETEFGYFETRAEFRQKIKILQPGAVIAGRIQGQLCNERDGTCTLFEHPFKL